MANINKLIDIDALKTYNDQLHTDLDSTTIAHKSEDAAANGTYKLYGFDGVNLKPLDLQVTKNGDNYTLSHYSSSTKIEINTLYNITLKSGLSARYLGANSFSCKGGAVTDNPTYDTHITNKKYVDSQVSAVSTNLSSMYTITTSTTEPSE